MMAPHADNPLFVCLLLLLKYGHRSFVLNRRKTYQHTAAMYNLYVVQITDLNLNVQTKQE